MEITGRQACRPAGQSKQTDRHSKKPGTQTGRSTEQAGRQIMWADRQILHVDRVARGHADGPAEQGDRQTREPFLKGKAQYS
jgi:hypothetical protein